MATRQDLADWLTDALRDHEGQASIIDVCKHVWRKHEQDLKNSGDLFYTWQYDIRWAAMRLRKAGVMRDETVSPKEVWELNA